MAQDSPRTIPDRITSTTAQDSPYYPRKADPGSSPYFSCQSEPSSVLRGASAPPARGRSSLSITTTINTPSRSGRQAEEDDDKMELPRSPTPPISSQKRIQGFSQVAVDSLARTLHFRSKLASSDPIEPPAVTDEPPAKRAKPSIPIERPRVSREDMGVTSATVEVAGLMNMVQRMKVVLVQGAYSLR